MSSVPTVSVLMPVWNPHPDYFRQAIQSILNQTFTDWELVIVEDPSPRSAADILRAFDDPRIRHFVRQQRTSLGDAMNFGLEKSRADLVAIMHADDLCEPDRLEKQVAFMKAHPEVTVLGSQLAVIDENGRLLGYRLYPCDNDAIIRALYRYNAVGHPGVILRKQPVLQAGGYQSMDFAEDYELWCRLAKRGKKFAALPEALVRYRVSPKSLSKGSRTHDVLSTTIKVKSQYWRGEMDGWARVRLLAERLLLLLPPRLIVWLFLKTQLAPTLDARKQ